MEWNEDVPALVAVAGRDAAALSGRSLLPGQVVHGAGGTVVRVACSPAGTASVTSHGFQYLVAPGEVNDVSVTATSIGDPRVWEFTDTGGSPVLAGFGCAVVDADTVVCTKPEEGPFQFDDLLVRLGDMDDSVSVANLCPDCEVGGGFFGIISLLGEAGEDEITGGLSGFATACSEARATTRSSAG